MNYLMGIDLGTSSLKTLIADENGNVVAAASEGYDFAVPKSGYAEQDPEEWWGACVRTIREALAKSGLSGDQIRGISFSGQMHGLVSLDDAGKPVRPVILHCDSRSGRQVEELNQLLGRKNVLKWMMNPVYTGFLLPSLLWVRENEPDNFSRIRKVCLPKDYLRYCLTGEVNADYSDSSATLAFDIRQGCWSKQILDKVGIDLSLFPECFDTTAVTGTVTREAAELTGLRCGTPVIAGGGDQVMQQIGNGITRPGIASANIGTSGQVSFQSLAPIENSALCTNTFIGFAKDRYFTMGAIMNAGLCYRWLNTLLRETELDKVNEEIAKVAPGSEGLIFLPYLTGERTPHLDPDLRGAFLGLSMRTSRITMARAVMEGVTYALMQCIELCGGLGLTADTVIASGGGARSLPWLQMQADMYNVPLKIAEIQEQAGLGAAIAAGVGSGVYTDIEEGCRRAVRYRDMKILPNAANHSRYVEYYQIYKEAFTANHVLLDRLTQISR